MKHAHHTGSRGAKPKAAATSTAAHEEPAVLDSDLEVQIREAAYFRYLARGAEVGRELEDWLQAESELLKAEKPDAPTH
jgi:hypothetical protein